MTANQIAYWKMRTELHEKEEDIRVRESELAERKRANLMAEQQKGVDQFLNLVEAVIDAESRIGAAAIGAAAKMAG